MTRTTIRSSVAARLYEILAVEPKDARNPLLKYEEDDSGHSLFLNTPEYDAVLKRHCGGKLEMRMTLTELRQEETFIIDGNSQLSKSRRSWSRLHGAHGPVIPVKIERAAELGSRIAAAVEDAFSLVRDEVLAATPKIINPRSRGGPNLE